MAVAPLRSFRQRLECRRTVMLQSFRVLLVEDDDSLRICLGEFLADNGWDVVATALGNEAIRIAREQRFDFSILDFHLLDGRTGLEVFQTIRTFRPLPAILMSGAASREEAVIAQQAGVFTFLRKPLELERLRQSVHHLIQHHFGGPLVQPRNYPR
ncbi:MAG: response regulator [Planctomycetes bacterium]|nr:response regulator [Planctomycetota bacterium]